MINNKNMPNWAYYQQNGKTADENYREQIIMRQRKRQLENPKDRDRASNKIDDSVIISEIEKTIDEKLSKVVDELFKDWK